MAISLFEHNETAYFAALSMMKNTGKAAIVHPTGTGKAFMRKKFKKIRRACSPTEIESDARRGRRISRRIAPFAR